MTRPLVLSSLLVLALSGPAACSGPVHEKTLANGLKVVVREDHRAPVVVSQIWYKVGAIDEPEGLTGLSHVLEHMMFKGTKKHKPGEFSRIIAEQGGRENAFTGMDYTAYFQTLEKSRLGISFELESDRMQNLLLTDEEFQKEVKVVMEERRLRTEDNPQALTYERFMATAYRVHPYRHPVIGWMKDLEAMTVKDLQRWYEQWYSPGNATLVVVGDVEPKEVFRLAQKTFGAVKPRPTGSRSLPAEPKQTKPRRVRVAAPAKVPYLIMGYHVPVLSGGREDWQAYALMVLAGILDGGDSARFSRELVRGQQIAASAGAGYQSIARGPGLFMLDGTPANGRSIEDLEQALVAQIEKIKNEPVGERELKRVKAQVAASDVFGRDSVFYQAMRIGRLETVGLDHRLLDTFVDRLQAVSAAQVQQVARKYLVQSNRTVAVLDPLPMGEGQHRRRGGARHGKH